MAFVITRGGQAVTPRQETPKPPARQLVHVRFAGSSNGCTGAFFRNDVQMAVQLMAQRGYAISPEDAGMMWVWLSRQYYSVIGNKAKPDPEQAVWLTPGWMMSLIAEHSMECLEVLA